VEKAQRLEERRKESGTGGSKFLLSHQSHYVTSVTPPPPAILGGLDQLQILDKSYDNVVSSSQCLIYPKILPSCNNRHHFLSFSTFSIPSIRTPPPHQYIYPRLALSSKAIPARPSMPPLASAAFDARRPEVSGRTPKPMLCATAQAILQLLLPGWLFPWSPLLGDGILEDFVSTVLVKVYGYLGV
jgi:hypothetical protein